MKFVKLVGIDPDTLAGANTLSTEVAYYLVPARGEELRLTASVSDVQMGGVRRWLTVALFNDVFGGTSDTMLQLPRTVLQQHAAVDQFPIEAINRAMQLGGQSGVVRRGGVGRRGGDHLLAADRLPGAVAAVRHEQLGI